MKKGGLRTKKGVEELGEGYPTPSEGMRQSRQMGRGPSSKSRRGERVCVGGGRGGESPGGPGKPEGIGREAEAR